MRSLIFFFFIEKLFVNYLKQVELQYLIVKQFFCSLAAHERKPRNESNNMTLKRIYHSVIHGLLSWKRFNPRRKKANHNIYLPFDWHFHFAQGIFFGFSTFSIALTPFYFLLYQCKSQRQWVDILWDLRSHFMKFCQFNFFELFNLMFNLNFKEFM